MMQHEGNNSKLLDGFSILDNGVLIMSAEALKEFRDKLYSIPIGGVAYSPNSQLTQYIRVPGGWVFEVRTEFNERKPLARSISTTFIPFTPKEDDEG